MLEKFFNLKKRGTNVKTEVIAGITTFVTMAYIIFVNPSLISEGAGIIGGDAEKIFNGVFFATCISAFIGTALMALLANLPFAQAPGMGLNAMFAFTVMVGFGIPYNQALGIVFISGLLFIAITVLGFREAIVRAIPKNIKIAISAGIGLFLAFLGLQNAHIVVANPATLVSMVDFSKIADPEQGAFVMSALVAVIGLMIITILSKLKVKGAILIGIVVSTLIGIPMGVTQLPQSFNFQFGEQFSNFLEVSLFSCFSGLVDMFSGQDFLTAIGTIIMLVITFSLVDMFDTIGTLLGTAKKADLLDENGNMPSMNKALLCDSIATTAGAMLGTSTVTTYVESSAGIGEGGKTGLTSLVTAVLFLVALIFAPFIGIIPGAATAPALIYVGCLMITAVKDVDWVDISEAIPAFLTVALMPLTYSIANGIALGIISHIIIKACTGKFKEIHIVTVVIAILFVIRFFLAGA